MLIINNKETVTYHPIIKYLPQKFKKLMSFVNLSDAEEIRLRKGLPLVINFSDKSMFITESGVFTNALKNAVTVTDSDIKEALELIVKSSLYTAQDSLKQGFVTIEGGNRIGISGSAVITGNEISSIKNISGLNYRIAKEICGVSDNVINNIYRNGKALNTLKIAVKACAIAYITEFASALCKDAGETAIAVKTEFAGKISILFLSMPIIFSFLSSISDLLDKI